MKKLHPGGMLSANGIAVQRSDDIVQFSCGDMKYLISDQADQWWKLFLEDAQAIDPVFESMAFHDAKPSATNVGTILFPIADKQSWMREVQVAEIKSLGIKEALMLAESRDYLGANLVCPQDHRIRACELCGDPGASYGPWRIVLDEEPGKSGLIGGAGTFKEVTEEVDRMLDKGIPEPIPRWRHDATTVVAFPKGLTAVVRPRTNGLDGIITEEYSVELLDHNLKHLTEFDIGEDLPQVIRLRDDLELLEQTLGQRCPDFDFTTDQSHERKNYDELPEFDYYGPEGQVVEQDIGEGIRVTVRNNIGGPDEPAMCEAQIVLSGQATLKVMGHESDQGGPMLSAEVLINGKPRKVPFLTNEQRLEPILRSVQRGSITVKSLMHPEKDTHPERDIPF